MITVIRRYFKNGSQVVLWLIVAAFIIGLMPMAFRHMSEAAIWAIKVNGHTIGYQEFMLERERQREKVIAFREQYGEYADWLLALMGATDPQSLAVRSLIRHALLTQTARTLGLHMSPRAIEQRLSDGAFVREELADIIPPQLIDSFGGIDQSLLVRYVKHKGMSVESFEHHIEETLLEKLVTDIVASTMYVPAFDIAQKVVAATAQRSFSLLTIPLELFIKKEEQKEVAADALAAFYKERNAKNGHYTVPQKRSGMLWRFDPKSYHIAITDGQLHDYYEQHKIQKYMETPAMVEVRRILIGVPAAHQRVAMQEKAAQIKDELLAHPTSFAALAKRVSDDASSAANGGLLKPFAKGTHEPALDRAAFLLQKDGDISDVVETSRGFEIVQRVSKSTPKFKPFETVKQEIKNSLFAQTFQKQFSADMRKVIDDETALSSFIKEKGGTPMALKEVVLDASPLAEHLFKLTVGQRTFFIEGDKGVAVRLDTIHESYVPSLDTIKATVVRDYRHMRAQEALYQTLGEVQVALRSQPLKEVAKKFSAEVTETGLLSAADEKAVESLKKKGVPVAQMLQMEKVGALMRDVTDGHGFVIRLDTVKPVEQEQLAEKKDEITGAFKQERGGQYLEGFVASLYRNATIETNESVITLQV